MEGIYVIVLLVSISLGIFILAVLIRLWSVLGDVRLACRCLANQFSHQSPLQE